MRQYRLIYDTPANGVWNMAVDEAILGAVIAGEAPPTLRFYGWNPPCLSLGYGQSFADVDVARLDYFGWDVVRRATGGKAILHTDELTYSLIVPQNHPLAQGSIVDSYRHISSGLMAGLNMLGATLHADKRADDTKITGAVCFETPSHYEITAPDGRKLVGSAQLRRRGGVLQHGTLPLTGDLSRICEVLTFENDEARQIAKHKVIQRAITLREALGRFVSWGEASHALVQGFIMTFDAQFEEGQLTPSEIAHAEQIAQTTYADVNRIQNP
ncbi:MAG: lipoate--protein ligase family protein [bacterium]|nr:lipoate--protein ligase family protein [bacterium]